MFEIIRNFFTGPGHAEVRADGSDWQRDPLSHPALARMTPAELADLPLGRTRFADNRNGSCDERLCA